MFNQGVFLHLYLMLVAKLYHFCYVSYNFISAMKFGKAEYWPADFFD